MTAMLSGLFALASLVAGAVLATHVVRSLRQGHVSKQGGRVRIERASKPGAYWWDVASNGLLAAVLLLGAAWILSRLFRVFG
jgi:hypothetical protein